jgi:hypothetical protein
VDKGDKVVKVLKGIKVLNAQDWGKSRRMGLRGGVEIVN